MRRASNHVHDFYLFFFAAIWPAGPASAEKQGLATFVEPVPGSLQREKEGIVVEARWVCLVLRVPCMFGFLKGNQQIRNGMCFFFGGGRGSKSLKQTRTTLVCRTPGAPHLLEPLTPSWRLQAPVASALSTEGVANHPKTRAERRRGAASRRRDLRWLFPVFPWF